MSGPGTASKDAASTGGTAGADVSDTGVAGMDAGNTAAAVVGDTEQNDRDPFALHDRHVLVTGASSGLGQAACVMIAARGGRVLATGRDRDRLDATVAALPGEGHGAIAADLTAPGELAALVKASDAVDGLVLAAGIARVSPLRYTTAKALGPVLAINLEARLALCQSLAAKRKLADGASIVFVSSLSVVQGVSGHAAYAASLAANEGASRAIAAELVGRRIRSNVVAPGLVRTPVLDGGDIPAERTEAMIAKYPLGVGEPVDVAAAIVYLLAPASRWVTGQVIRLDGGYTLDA